MKITYYAVQGLREVLVIRENGRLVKITPTGVTYKTQSAAEQALVAKNCSGRAI